MDFLLGALALEVLGAVDGAPRPAEAPPVLEAPVLEELCANSLGRAIRRGY
jgi:hypothetical protein